MSKTLLLGVDPGGTIGTALYGYVEEGKSKEEPQPYWKLETWALPTQGSLVEVVRTWQAHIKGIVVEDFIGSGPRTHEAILTLKLVGGVIGMALAFEIPYRVQYPQFRKAFVAQAQRMLPKDATIHEADALAHVLAYMKEIERRASSE